MEQKQKNNPKTLIVLTTLLLAAITGGVVLYAKEQNAFDARDRAILKSDSLGSASLDMAKRNKDLSRDLSSCDTKLRNMELNVAELEKNIELKQRELKRAEASGNYQKSQKVNEITRKNSECNKLVADLQKEVARLQSELSEKTTQMLACAVDHRELQSKLNIASRLRVYDIAVHAYKNKKITTRARRVNRLRIDFLIAENRLAESGSRQVFVVLVDPDGKVVSESGKKFQNKEQEKEQVMTASAMVTYNNEDLRSGVDLECNCRFAKGKHRLEFYIDGRLAGKKDFDLR